MTYQELSTRCTDSQKAVAKRREKYLIWCDDLQKVFLNVSIHCSRRGPEPVSARVIRAIDDIDREIKTGTVVSLKPVIEKFIAVLKEDQEPSSTITKAEQLGLRRSSADQKIADTFAAAHREPIELAKIQDFQVARPLRKVTS